MEQHDRPRSLFELLGQVPDPRRREGRIYPLRSILAILILAALNGESSLRGMWIWAKDREKKLAGDTRLDFWSVGRLPALSAIWYVLRRLDVETLNEVVGVWAGWWGCGEAVSVDGKTLRGSKREGMAALQVVTAAAQAAGMLLGQRGVVGGDTVEAAIALLEELPLEGRIVSMDAGLLQRSVVKQVVGKGGPISGC